MIGGKYWRGAFERDAGLRIDHFLLSPPVAKRLRSAGVDREVRGRSGCSDHAPVWIELAPEKRKVQPTSSAGGR
jgi:exodeoxyribonuclease-3